MFHHITVLKEEATEGLNIKQDGIYVDCTLGGGGHSSVIASKLGPGGRLIALDQDDWALDNAQREARCLWRTCNIGENQFSRSGTGTQGSGCYQ